MSHLIKQIFQKDNHTFTIEWTDGKRQDIRLSILQKHCPCANCVDENTGKRVVDPTSIKDDVRAYTVRSVGRYALQVQFTTGCSTGIYGFDLLRQL